MKTFNRVKALQLLRRSIPEAAARGTCAGVLMEGKRCCAIAALALVAGIPPAQLLRRNNMISLIDTDYSNTACFIDEIATRCYSEVKIDILNESDFAASDGDAQAAAKVLRRAYRALKEKWPASYKKSLPTYS